MQELFKADDGPGLGNGNEYLGIEFGPVPLDCLSLSIIGQWKSMVMEGCCKSSQLPVKLGLSTLPRTIHIIQIKSAHTPVNAGLWSVWYHTRLHRSWPDHILWLGWPERCHILGWQRIYQHWYNLKPGCWPQASVTNGTLLQIGACMSGHSKRSTFRGCSGFQRGMESFRNSTYNMHVSGTALICT